MEKEVWIDKKFVKTSWFLFLFQWKCVSVRAHAIFGLKHDYTCIDFKQTILSDCTANFI